VQDALLEKMAGEVTLSMDPGATLRKWRETFQLQQSELAGLLGVSASVVSDYESGRRKSPGIGTVKKIVEALVSADESRGGHVLAKYHSLLDPTEGILAIGEYRRTVSAREFMDRIEGRPMATAGLDEKQLQGYTLIDSVKAIASLNANDYVRVFGWSTQRALVFTGIKYGRSPMIAIRVHPMKPSLVVYHRPEDVDKLAFRLAEAERIPLVITELEMPELEARLRTMAEPGVSDGRASAANGPGSDGRERTSGKG
jgi:putative transcriptional regulator